MNNKLIKLVAVVVLSVMALGTCAFASTISDANYSHSSTAISFTLAPAADATQMTYVAYAGNTGGTIVAIDQVASSETTQNVVIDSAKLEGVEQIVLNSGDDVSTERSQVVLPLAQVTEAIITFKNKGDAGRQIELDGVLYGAVPIFSLSIEKLSDTEKPFTIEKLIARSESAGVEHELNIAEAGFPTITGKGGIFVDNLYIIGAPKAYAYAEDATIVPEFTSLD